MGILIAIKIRYYIINTSMTHAFKMVGTWEKEGRFIQIFWKQFLAETYS